MRMGEHTASLAAEHPTGSPPVFGTEAVDERPATVYRGLVEWSPAVAVHHVTLESLSQSATLHLARLTLYDAQAGASCPLTALHMLTSQPERWERVSEDGAYTVLRNRKSLPRAWIVPRTVALDPDAIVASIQAGRLPDGSRFDPRALALVEGEEGRVFGPPDPGAEVRISTFRPNLVELHSRSDEPALLVLSEVYYPGWVAEVDDQPAPIVRTDYILRGVALPAGEHRIRFVYRPLSVIIGVAISGATVVALAGVGGWRLARRRRNIRCS